MFEISNKLFEISKICVIIVNGDDMKVYYDKLWHLLLDKNINKTILCEKTKISSSTMAKMSKNEPVELQILYKICMILNCDLCDIVSFHQDKEVTK